MGALLGEALLLGTLVFFQSGPSSSPYYTEASIANTAASIAGYYAPNSFVTVYGVNLAFTTAALTADDIAAGMLPIDLPGTGVHVLINQTAADIYYVSPGQINLLIPNYLAAGPATLQIEVDGVAGPAVEITLTAVAPAMYQTDATTVLAIHLDGTIVSSTAPAQPGEVIVFWATGLGPTLPEPEPNQVPESAATLATPGFDVWLNGAPVDTELILYAGVSPGFAGLYQINLKLPADAPANPQIQIGWSGQLSPPQLFLPVQ